MFKHYHINTDLKFSQDWEKERGRVKILLKELKTIKDR